MMSKGKAVFRPPEPSDSGKLSMGIAILATHWFAPRNNGKTFAKTAINL
jgi:hypothetical protein